MWEKEVEIECKHTSIKVYFLRSPKFTGEVEEMPSMKKEGTGKEVFQETESRFSRKSK